MKKLFIIKLGSTFPELAEKIGDFEDWISDGLGETSYEIKIVDLVNEDRLPDINDCAGVVLTGSHSMLTENPSIVFDTEIWLKNLAKNDIPVLGICYGHQLLAKVFGGDVQFCPQGIEIGTVEIILKKDAENDPLFAGLPDKIFVHEAHSQSATVLPEGAVRLTGNDNDINQAFRLGKCIWGVQFHPEYNSFITKAYIKKVFAGLKSEGMDADSLLKNVRETPQAFDLLQKFSKLVFQNSRKTFPG